VRPKLEAFGFHSPDDMFRRCFEEQCARRSNGARFLSVGSGNCDLEVQLAVHLRSRGYTGFVIDCVDLNPLMLERGVAAGRAAGVVNQIHVIQADFNDWNPGRQYDGVMSNQALHHVLNLEGLFARIKRSLRPQGCFVISDIIGRNGHQRWPEALKLVHEFWRKLPPSYRFNQQLQCYEELYENRACSAESFEGIRSEDILPLLLDSFHFQLFIGFANIIVPFVDRSFGHNFEAIEEWDRAFIDQVHQCDEGELASGRIKPTQMLAVVGNESDVPTRFHPPMSPEFCLRPPGLIQSAEAVPDPYQWDAWPHKPQRELEFACRFREAERQLDERSGWALQLDKQLAERTTWALKLDRDVEERTAWIRRLQQELQERTAWALQIDQQLKERTAWALRLDQRAQERTAWALRLDQRAQERTAWALQLDQQLAERTAWALGLDKEVQECTAWALRLDKELQERTAWALRLDQDLRRLSWAWRLDRVLRRLFRVAHRLLFWSGKTEGRVGVSATRNSDT
jgi:SAM-dependent methyltransferase